VLGWKGGKLASLTKMKDVTLTYPWTHTVRKPEWIWAEDEKDGRIQRERKQKIMAAFKEAISEIMKQSQKKVHASWIATPNEAAGFDGKECVRIFHGSWVSPLSFDTSRCDNWMNSFICQLLNY